VIRDLMNLGRTPEEAEQQSSQRYAHKLLE